MTDGNNLIVVTGGPSAGKSTLIAALSDRGFATAPEAGRAIIRQQVAIGGRALPWVDAELFSEMMLSWDMRSYAGFAGTAELVFFDRGIPDIAGYLKLIGRPMPLHVAKAAERYRYCTRVFICPPWREIFVNDSERRQDFDEAQRTFDVIGQVYDALGYELIEVPKTDLERRVQFILETLAHASD